MEEKNQRINCTVESCKYHNYNHNVCQLQQIEVQACQNCSTGTPQDESMCGNYCCKCE